jgi:hypothetical protein
MLSLYQRSENLIMVIEKCHLHFLDNLLVAYPYTNQCILIARIITVVLRKYYTKTLIILRRQSYFKNVSRRGARAVASKRAAGAAASTRIAEAAASMRATGTGDGGIEEGSRGSDVGQPHRGG